MELKLKPCPFCSGKGRVRKLKKNGYRIVCEECGASSHYAFVQPWHDNKFVAQCQAAKAWNSRDREDNVVHGSWNKYHIGITSKLVCSRCGHEEIYSEPSNYCPNCGANMDIKG